MAETSLKWEFCKLKILSFSAITDLRGSSLKRRRLLKFLQVAHDLAPVISVLPGCVRSVRIGIEGEYVLFQVRRDIAKLLVGQLTEQLCIGPVGERVLAGFCLFSRIAIVVLEPQVALP